MPCDLVVEIWFHFYNVVILDIRLFSPQCLPAAAVLIAGGFVHLFLRLLQFYRLFLVPCDH